MWLQTCDSINFEVKRGWATRLDELERSLQSQVVVLDICRLGVRGVDVRIKCPDGVFWIINKASQLAGSEADYIGGLVLSRRTRESITLYGNANNSPDILTQFLETGITVSVGNLITNQIRLTISAPPSFAIVRSELLPESIRSQGDVRSSRTVRHSSPLRV